MAVDQRVIPAKAELIDIMLRTFASLKIFEARVGRIRFRLRILSFVSIAIPLVIGLTALSGGSDGFPKWGYMFAAIILGIQALFSLWTMVDGWEEKLNRAPALAAANLRIYRAAESALRSDDFAELTEIVSNLKQDEETQIAHDETQVIAEYERRYGYRAAHLQLAKKCATCNEVPKTEKPPKRNGDQQPCTMCCGFRLWRIKI